MIKKRLNIRMSGLGGQGAVTAAHVMAMAANRDGRFSISNPFFGAEKRMAPAESYCRIGIERIYDRGELVFPDVIEVFHPQVITMGKSYTMPFYSGIKEGGVVIINSGQPLLSEEDVQRLKDLNVAVFYIAGTELAIEIAPRPPLQFEFKVAFFIFSGFRQQSQIGRRRRQGRGEGRDDLLPQLIQ